MKRNKTYFEIVEIKSKVGSRQIRHSHRGGWQHIDRVERLRMTPNMEQWHIMRMTVELSQSEAGCGVDAAGDWHQSRHSGGSGAIVGLGLVKLESVFLVSCVLGFIIFGSVFFIYGLCFRLVSYPLSFNNYKYISVPFLSSQTL